MEAVKQGLSSWYRKYSTDTKRNKVFHSLQRKSHFSWQITGKVKRMGKGLINTSIRNLDPYTSRNCILSGDHSPSKEKNHYFLLSWDSFPLPMNRIYASKSMPKKVGGFRALIRKVRCTFITFAFAVSTKGEDPEHSITFVNPPSPVAQRSHPGAEFSWHPDRQVTQPQTWTFYKL